MTLVDTAVIGRKGGNARAKSLSAKERTDSARDAANARWDRFRADANKKAGKKAGKKAEAKR